MFDFRISISFVSSFSYLLLLSFQFLFSLLFYFLFLEGGIAPEESETKGKDADSETKIETDSTDGKKDDKTASKKGKKEESKSKSKKGKKAEKKVKKDNILRRFLTGACVTLKNILRNFV